MTLDELVLENFGIYRSRHVIRLTPPSKKKPIVLLGGMNGAGKTTVLDALQLALYGRRARCSNRGSSSYEDFLRSSVNRKADPVGGASVEIHFHHVSEGREQSYRVCRSWHANGNGMKEVVEVFVNGQHDRAVSDAWAEYAEEFIPARLSHLFFFDGEKIEALADLENAADLLRTGIHSLLGLDIVDRLHVDLNVVAGRKDKKLQVDDGAEAAIKVAIGELNGIRAKRTELVQALGSVQSQIEQCNYRQQKVLERLQAEGGDLFKQKDMFAEGKRRLEADIEAIDGLLRDDSNGAAPLALVADLLGELQLQARAEKVASEAQLLGAILEERDAAIIQRILDRKAKPQFVQEIATFLERDRSNRASKAGMCCYLELTEEAMGLLQELISSGLPALDSRLRTQLTRRHDFSHDLAVVDRKLSMVPEEDAIAPLEAERTELEQRLNALAQEKYRLEGERTRLDAETDRKEASLTRRIESVTRCQLEKEDLRRVKEHSHRAQEALQRFREKVVERHIAVIQAHVLASFQYLVRKKSLVSLIRIDSRSFEIELRDSEWNLVRPDRLSAGERQVLAVSLLWGLAKASRRPLPAVIDTPLGRLDSSHRRHLVERYFPHASHQVLLLSTDEEIKGEYLEAIRPFVGHSYLLEFDEAQQSSTVKAGYFDREEDNVA
jgi:DNA sulfur modification protein DndD